MDGGRLAMRGTKEELKLFELIKNDISYRISEANEKKFWFEAGLESIEKIWENEEDDIYSDLLKR